MKIVVSVSNDIVTDQRVHRVCNTLIDNDFKVVLLGRKKQNSPTLGIYSFETKRFRLLFEKGPLFYACLNMRLFLYLLFVKADIFLSNDLDTLPANYYAAKIRCKKLVYDSHELFTEVPELQGRPRVKAFWERIEKRILPNIKYSYTVCESIAAYYNQKYGIEMHVVRNVPTKKEIQIPFHERGNVFIYQGVLNKGRGLEMLIESMVHLKEYQLIIAGSGDIEDKLKHIAAEHKADNVLFAGRIPPEALHALTCKAILGFSLEEDLGLNYRFALPNKIFDYIQAGVPVMVSKLPEMEKLVTLYTVGQCSLATTVQQLSGEIQKIIGNKSYRELYHPNCLKAAETLHWGNEKQILTSLFESIKS
ncbi:MAG TPA: glycosyltransferase [Bacteroidales bacterium]|nr:glycosyltransferase [Bacteroidales bacterium]